MTGTCRGVTCGRPRPVALALVFAAATVILGLLWWQERSARLARAHQDTVNRWAWEVRELVDQATGEVVMRHEDMGEKRFRRVK